MSPSLADIAPEIPAPTEPRLPLFAAPANASLMVVALEGLYPSSRSRVRRAIRSISSWISESNAIFSL